MSWHNREELLHQIVLLHAQGTAQRAIARALGISRNTVKVLIGLHRVQRESAHTALPERPSRAPRARKIDAYRLRVAALLEKYPDITAQRVFEILREEGFDGGQTAVRKYVREARPAKKPAPSLTTPDYGPGEMSESDWSPYEMRFTTGKKATIQALSYVLVHSKRKFFELYESCDLHALMDGHALAFARFEGCAAECNVTPPRPASSTRLEVRHKLRSGGAHDDQEESWTAVGGAEMDAVEGAGGARGTCRVGSLGVEPGSVLRT